MTIHHNRFSPAFLRLERRDSDRNIARFYVLRLQKTLFGDWAVQCCWGRIGAQGASRSLWFGSEKEAITALHRLEHQKKCRGYQLRPVQLRLF